MRRRVRLVLPLLPRFPLTRPRDQWAERVLDRAEIRPGDTVADVGAGTGVLTFGALERVGANGAVIAFDVSAAALEALRRRAREQGVNGRVAFLIGQADVLPLPDGSVDVVVAGPGQPTADEAREFFRVLRPRGRVSLAGEGDLRGVFEAAGFDVDVELGAAERTRYVSGAKPA